jgi:hypothetical protein
MAPTVSQAPSLGRDITASPDAIIAHDVDHAGDLRVPGRAGTSLISLSLNFSSTMPYDVLVLGATGTQYCQCYHNTGF